MKIYKTSKLVLWIKGDYAKFISNLSSNKLNSKNNAFLDKFGKIVTTFNQTIKDKKFYIILESQFYDRLYKHLEKYLKLSKVELVKTNFVAYYNLDKKELEISEEDIKSTVSEEEFTKWRVQNNITIQGKDYDREMVLNVSEDLVSFEKGCYLGQEIVAKVKYKSKPPKKLIVRGNKFEFVSN
jgi:tRNA-modifying protein YgfZ